MKKGQKTVFPVTSYKKETPGNSIPPQSPVRLDPPVKMDVEDKKEDINLDILLDEENKSKNNVIDLNDEKSIKKKTKKEYDIDDTIIRDITLAGDIHVRLLSNTNGYFVDIRKYFNGFPTKKGIRMLATKFNIAANYLKKDLESVLGRPAFEEEK